MNTTLQLVLLLSVVAALFITAILSYKIGQADGYMDASEARMSEYEEIQPTDNI